MKQHQIQWTETEKRQIQLMAEAINASKLTQITVARAGMRIGFWLLFFGLSVLVGGYLLTHLASP